MEIISSYGVEIKKQNICFKKTFEIYRKAVAWLIPVYEQEWETLSQIRDANKQFNDAEHLVHTTKGNCAPYDFDSAFRKMPSYLRRSVIRHALGAVSSYMSLKEKWKKHAISGEPKLSAQHYDMPAFYRDNMYIPGEEGSDEAQLKLYNGSDWVFVKVKLLHTDMQYLRKYWSGRKESAPVLEKKHGKYFLRFTFKTLRKLTDKKIQEQRICAVDLGINTDAVCSVMTADGTVLARKFIDFASDKDRMYRVLNRIRKSQKQHGRCSTGNKWRYANHLNHELSGKIAEAIAAFALEQECDVIVFEYLDMKGKIRGKKKQKLTVWRKREIQKICTRRAHMAGLRVSRAA